MRLPYPEYMDYSGTSNQPPRPMTKFWNLSPHYHHYHTHRNSGKGVMRITMSTGPTMSSRVHRKVIRVPPKRQPGKAFPGKSFPGKIHAMSRGKIPPGKRLPARVASASAGHCDNSNDSGVGFEHAANAQSASNGADGNFQSTGAASSSSRTDASVAASSGAAAAAAAAVQSLQRQQHQQQQQNVAPVSTSRLQYVQSSPRFIASSLARQAIRPAVRRVCGPGAASPIQANSVQSRDGRCQLQIVAQPEQQHRARYQTEGSRGAVKDRTGNSFPIVRLTGYTKPATLEIFIGTDIGRVMPHMFYQACKVSGKNSTPCVEKKQDGTMVIEIELRPDSDMQATCDCVGILKERNVDVEHRFPDQMTPRSKKKSTRCRMVFRTELQLDDGTTETLQICSQQIICTQPPGVPEISKKSLVSCPVSGGLELYILGKNFLKDTRITFQQRRPSVGSAAAAGASSVSIASPSSTTSSSSGGSTAVIAASSPADSVDYEDILWAESVVPDKEYLQQTHLCCVVPAYANLEITEPVDVELFVTSSNKTSESHTFTYFPHGYHTLLTASTTRSAQPRPDAADAAVAAAAAALTSAGNASNGSAVGGVGGGGVCNPVLQGTFARFAP